MVFRFLFPYCNCSPGLSYVHLTTGARDLINPRALLLNASALSPSGGGEGREGGDQPDVLVLYRVFINQFVSFFNLSPGTEWFCTGDTF